MPVATVNAAWPDISLPWSQVRERRRAAGRVVIFAATAAATVRRCGRRAGRMMRQNRVVRSARVATADCPSLPMIRSPSQWPGTARSAASAGRSLILIIPAIFPPGLQPRGSGAGAAGPARTAPPRRPRRAGCPCPARTGPGRSSRGSPAAPAGQGSHASACPRSGPVNNPRAAAPRPAPAPPCRAPASAAGPAAPALPPRCAPTTAGTAAARTRSCAPAPATPSTATGPPPGDHPDAFPPPPALSDVLPLLQRQPATRHSTLRFPARDPGTLIIPGCCNRVWTVS